LGRSTKSNARCQHAPPSGAKKTPRTKRRLETLWRLRPFARAVEAAANCMAA
jgi:hypothetical protein